MRLNLFPGRVVIIDLTIGNGNEYLALLAHVERRLASRRRERVVQLLKVAIRELKVVSGAVLADVLRAAGFRNYDQIRIAEYPRESDLRGRRIVSCSNGFQRLIGEHSSLFRAIVSER